MRTLIIKRSYYMMKQKRDGDSFEGINKIITKINIRKKKKGVK